jgi:uncharacterized protein YueI
MQDRSLEHSRKLYLSPFHLPTIYYLDSLAVLSIDFQKYPDYLHIFDQNLSLQTIITEHRYHTRIELHLTLYKATLPNQI